MKRGDGATYATLLLYIYIQTCNHYRRPGPNGTDLLNPGSAGMPLDGDVRAAWALRRDGGDFEFRRSEYDVERVAAAWRALASPWSEQAATRIERGSD